MSGTLADKAISAISARAAGMQSAQEPNAPQFDWSGFIFIAFDLLGQVLTNCMNKTSAAEVNEKMQRPGFYRARRISQAIDKAERKTGEKLSLAKRWMAFKAIQEELDATDPEVTGELLQELQTDAEAADWSILG